MMKKKLYIASEEFVLGFLLGIVFGAFILFVIAFAYVLHLLFPNFRGKIGFELRIRDKVILEPWQTNFAVHYLGSVLGVIVRYLLS